jgi:alpha-tubulin suppressor-like RCC1 family protein
VAGGGEFGCALLDDGRVRCWGANDRGQLGNGTTVASFVPVDVAGLPASPSRAVAVATGWAHACAAVSSGDVWCWGDNSTGELGPGATAAFSTTPVRVTGVTGVAAPATRASPPTLAAGGGTSTTAPTVFGHSCAVGSGGLACWGANDSGQLGNGTTTQSATPVAIGLPTVTSIAAGQRHTCAVSAGALRCWGANGSGQVGDGTSSQRTTPTAVSTTSFPSGSTATFVATSRASTCAVVTGTAPQLFCWGENGSGQVTASAPPPATQLTPIAPSLGGGFQPLWVSAGRAHVCGLEPGTNGLKCFGANGLSQLSGAPTAIGKNDVVLGAAGGLATTVAAGGDHSCALLVDGSIQCWGANDRGQTGTGLPDATLTTPTFLSGR